MVVDDAGMVVADVGMVVDGGGCCGMVVQGVDWLCNGESVRDRDRDSVSDVLGGEQFSYSNGKQKQQNRRLDPEYWKTALSSVYVTLVFGFTSFVMVIVHERVPDMRTYPPLPDIFLDSVPRIPGPSPWQRRVE
ncbi:hypothetical protein HF521_021002 [Silurus meridionalis]|uniref:Uncharacterized protein n=1 Tax=Silurus meridionalis TaxID=175797 RepID=A0A8T0BJM8_SILME|nr:hypothetical protein HF521_021002 [Silurus meridionalis]